MSVARTGDQPEVLPEPVSPRALLAQIALAPCPMPQTISMNGGQEDRPRSVSLFLGTLDDGRIWATYLDPCHERGTYVKDGQVRLDPFGQAPPWNGWHVIVHASSPAPTAPVDELPEPTRTALARVTRSEHAGEDQS